MEDDCLLKSHKLFIEHQHLKREWDQTARWIEFEERVEEGSFKWSNPLVSVIAMPAFGLLKSSLEAGLIVSDLNCESFIHLVQSIVRIMKSLEKYSDSTRRAFRDILLTTHNHQPQLSGSSNERFRKVLPELLEGVSVLTGEVRSLTSPLCVFVRLEKPIHMKVLTEVKLPTRFVLIYLTNKESAVPSRELGRAFAALMTQQDFVQTCYDSPLRETPRQILKFLETSFVIPGSWNPTVRLSASILETAAEVTRKVDEQVEEDSEFREECGLVKSGRPFGGLFRDVGRKMGHYCSDFQGVFSSQVISTTLFMYFACLAAVVTFGGQLSEATGSNLATIESLLAASLSGFAFALLSGQPLALLSCTGPMIAFEGFVHQICFKLGWDYISFRFWVGMWVVAMLLYLVESDASAAFGYVTRFTVESFSLVMCAIYVTTPLNYLWHLLQEQVLVPKEMKRINASGLVAVEDEIILLKFKYQPAVFLMSLLLIVLTCSVAMMLSHFNRAPYFGSKVRTFISEFSVSISILIMTLTDAIMDLNTEKLILPTDPTPTLASRTWLVTPFHPSNPTWSCFVAAFPALICAVLIFMSNQITITAVCRRERNLRKGVGFHLDLLIVALLIGTNSYLGLPWYSAGILLSMGHMEALEVELISGEKPKFVGYREQRVTGVLVSTLLGLSIFLTPILRFVPVPVLYGVFLHLAAISVGKLQLSQRLMLFLIPKKNMPDLMCLRKVPLKRVHMFTIAQCLTFVTLWMLKAWVETALLFPLVLVGMILTRKMLDRCFSQEHLMFLDDLLPCEHVKNKDLESSPKGATILNQKK